MKQNDPKDNTAKIKGTIKRTIQHADSVFYLTHEEDGTAHIYVLNNTTGALDTISTVGIVPVDPTNPGDHLALSDIAITCDGKLVGVNYVRCYYGASYVESGYKEGTSRFYIWDDFFADPALWFTSQFTSNSLKSDQGYTMALYGMSTNCHIITTGVHRYGNGARYSVYNVVNDMVASETYYGWELGAGTDEEAEFDEKYDGTDFRLTLSPRGEKTNLIMDAERMAPVEFQFPEASNQPLVVLGGLDSTLIGTKFQGASYFMYAGRSMMVTPFQNEEGFVAGLKLFDITDGLDKAVEVKLDYGFFEPYGAPTAHASAGAYVDGAVLNLYLYVDGLVWSFTTVGVQQPIVERMNALNLKVAKTEFDYIFSFVANQDAPYAAILFYDENKEVVEQIDIEATEGENQVRVAADMLPSEAKTWGITLTGAPVPGMGLVADHVDSTMLKPYAIVNSHPLTDQFGQLYVMEGTGDNKGLSIYDINMNKLNTTPYVSTDAAWDAPKRLAVASDGTLFIAEYSDNHSGVYVMDPAQPENITQFFAGTRDGKGVISNGGVNVGASTAGISIYKEGAESKLVVYNEDFGASLGNILIYNIGQEDGSIVKTWEGAPSEVYGKGSNLAGLVNKNGQPILTDYGFFVSTLRYAGGNNSYATSCRYYNFAQECEFSTHYDAYAPYVNGSNDGALALSNDQKYLVLPDDNNQFVVFECAWDEDGKLSVKYVESFVHNLGPVYQLSFDYAGNLIASAAGHVARYTMPTADNTIVIPAKTALADAPEYDPTAVENVKPAVLDRNAPMYDVLGRQVDKTYRGIVIQNGQAYLVR